MTFDLYGRGYVIFTREEGAYMEVWRARADEYERWKARGYMVDWQAPGAMEHRFKPAFMAFATEVAHFDFILGSTR